MLTLFFVIQSYSKKYGIYISSEELNGNVKFFTKSIYDAKNYFGETKTGDSIYSIFCKYDIKGKPIETVVSSYKNNGYGERGIFKKNNNFNEKIIKEVSYTLESKVE